MKWKKQCKDIEKYHKYAREWKRRYYGKTQYAPNHKKRWSDDDIEIIMKHELTDHEISAILGRSVKAIQLKRHNENERLKKLRELANE